jgi:hypothetical protein
MAGVAGSFEQQQLWPLLQSQLLPAEQQLLELPPRPLTFVSASSCAELAVCFAHPHQLYPPQRLLPLPLLLLPRTPQP